MGKRLIRIAAAVLAIVAVAALYLHVQFRRGVAQLIRGYTGLEHYRIVEETHSDYDWHEIGRAHV